MAHSLAPSFDRRIFHSFDDFERQVAEIVGDSKEWLYRGQAVVVPPAPRYFRESSGRPKSNADELEANHIALFRKQLGDRFPSDARSDWFVLTWLQHHGAPTRLLDWTYDPITALWFAAKARLADIEKGVAGQANFATVWLVKTKPTQWAHLAELGIRPSAVDKIMFAQPPEIDIRVLAQRSVFSVHHLPRSTLDAIQGGWNDLTNMLQSRDLISLSAEDSILTALFQSLKDKGVVKDSVFPDLEVVAANMRRNYVDAPAMKLLQSSVTVSWKNK